MKAVGCYLCAFFVASFLPLSAQQISSLPMPVTSAAPPALAPELQKKVLSSALLTHIAKKIGDARIRGVSTENSYITAFIYTPAYPTADFLAELNARGVRSTPESWIPPLVKHPLGFFIAQVPTDRLAEVLAIADVKKMDTAEREAVPLNNLAAIAIKANLAWANNWTGTGVKVAILDSGFDDRMPDAELPSNIVKRDYSAYPAIDTVVRNLTTGHGTHVAGSVLGRGGWSAGNTGNGGGAYKGMAPDAIPVLLKIGGDATSNATDAAMTGAVKAAVDSFSAKIITMSYGGWEAYHDGSDATSQAIDYAYSKGTACFLSAGNSGANGHHASGIVNAQDTSGYVEITVTAAGVNNRYLWMNLVWTDGAARNGLKLLYYNSEKTLLTTVTRVLPTESPRGTESEDSHYNYYVPSGNSTYYVRVVNPSAAAQPFHIYFYATFSNVVFAAPDQYYTIGSPAHADHAFAVGAHTSRVNWEASDGVLSQYAVVSPLSDIAYFSSRGPRIDGVVKPEITAPGTAIVSLRDRDVLTAASKYWIDNDGIADGPVNYYVMQGTSMATPVCAGAAALLFQHSPLATPQQIYEAIMLNAVVDGFTGSVPNSTWGYGKLNVNAAINNIPLPVELTSFTATARGNLVTLLWKTASEVNNYGFEIEKKPVVRTPGAGNQGFADAAPWSRVGFAPGNGTSNAPREYSYTDRLTVSGAYAYRLKQTDRDGKFEYSPEIEVVQGMSPIEYSLSQNYPNPFNPVTRIQFSIGADQQVRVAVYDLLGRAVAELVNEPMRAGRYTVEWNAWAASSGIYFYRIDAGKYSAVKKLVLQK